MRRETDVAAQNFQPLPVSAIRDKREALEELLRPCGRFKSPLPLEERLQGALARGFGRFDPLARNALAHVPGIPLNWDLLLRYLHQVGVIGDPYFHFDVFSNDGPKATSGWLRANLGDKTPEEALRMNLGAFASAGSLEETISKAVGEMLERHFFRQHKHAPLVTSSYDDLRRRKRTLELTDLNGFLPFQTELFPEFARDEKRMLKWVAATEVATGRTTYLPAQLVFWNYPLKDELVLLNPTTSGCAGHFTVEEALLGSLLENIQRDGFFIHWLNSISPKVLDVASVEDEALRELLAYAERYKLKLVFLNISTDIAVPSLACAVVDTLSQEPVISLGAAAGFDLKEMLLHAAREALSVYSYVSRIPRFSLPEKYGPFRDASIGRNERLNLWKGKEMLERFEFFISGPKQSVEEFMGDAERFVSVAERLTYILELFKAKGKGYEVYAYEIKNDVLKELGYHLVRTVVPQLFPLYLAEHMPTLDSKRLREVPEKLGYKMAAEFNPWPHPFP